MKRETPVPQTSAAPARGPHNSALEHEVGEAVDADRRPWKQLLEVDAARSRVMVRGRVGSQEHRDLVTSVAGQVKRVRNFELHLGPASDPPAPDPRWRN